MHRVERVRYPVGLPQVTYPDGLGLLGFLVLSATPPLLRVLRVRRYTTLRVVLCRDRGELGMLRIEVVTCPRDHEVTICPRDEELTTCPKDGVRRADGRTDHHQHYLS